MILLKNDIRKDIESISEERLNALINRQAPQITRFLSRLWGRQQNDIGYPEIRVAIETGTVSLDTLERWQQDYSRFVVDYLMPQWRVMMDQAVFHLEDSFSSFSFNPVSSEVMRYTSEHAAEFVRDCTAQQIDAVRGIVQRAAVLQDISVDELARQIRPTIGLNRMQATANLNYYRRVRSTLLKQHPHMRLSTATNRARIAAEKYAEVQHRYRASMIARTELAAAHNAGGFGGIKQAQEQGLIGKVLKQWITAATERTCEVCNALDMVTVEMDDYFPGTTVLLPPMHPHCMCVVNYIEQ